MHNRRGYGIWLHGTNEPERAALPYSTRGCVVLRNSDVEFLTPLIDIQETPIIIVEQIDYRPVDEMRREYIDIERLIRGWSSSWSDRDYETYKSFYASAFRSGGKDLDAWISFKQQILKKYESIEIEISNLRTFRADGYLYVEFHQQFKTDTYGDEGIKKLFLIEEDGQFRILSEEWAELSDN